MNVIIGEIDVKRIKIKKPLNLGNKRIFNLYYLSDDGTTENRFIIQSPELIIPYGIIKTPDIDEIQFDTCNDKFIENMEYIRDYIITKINNYDNNILDSKIHIDKIINKDFGKVLRFKIKNISDINIYNDEGTIIHYDNLKSERKINIIIELKWFSIYDAFFGLEYSVLQIKIQMPYSQSLFIQENTEQETNNIFEKYEKMLKLRIPLGAVESKMKLDAIHDDDIKIFLDKISKSEKEKEKEKEEVKSKSPLSCVSFLSQISGGNFKLKSVSQNQDNSEQIKKRVLDKMSKYLNMNSKPPSLDDILCAKANLRKI
jgi:hypothetical protein